MEIFEGRSFSIPFRRSRPVAREIRVDLRANYSSLFVAFQSRARRERLRGRNLVPEIAMYPVGQVPGPGSVRALRGKVIKAFVLPVHCRSNFVALQHSPRSNRNFESYSSPYSLRRKFRFQIFRLFSRSKSFLKASFQCFCSIRTMDLSSLASFPFFFVYNQNGVIDILRNRNFEFGNKMVYSRRIVEMIDRFSRIFIF